MMFEPGSAARLRQADNVTHSSHGKPTAGAAALQVRRETVLVVEDDAAVRATTARMLQRQGYDVVSTQDARIAFALCTGPERERIALVLSDVIMPNMGGIELAERLVAVRPGLRVLLMSGYSDENLDPAAIDATGSDLLRKPFAPAQLGGRVRALLDAGARAA
ncbi:MAG: response regulator [Longimicrobiales bacterium]